VRAGLFLTRHLQKKRLLLGRDLQLNSQQFSYLARWAAFVRLDFENQRNGATYPLCKLLLRQIKGFSPTFNPVSE
jgi:hypothetical protein